MSRRINSLETVRQVALSAERREATRLAECMRRREDKNQKLNYLKQYLDEYTDVLRDKGNQGMTVAALRLRRDFVHQLNVALGQQSGAIDAAERQVAEQRAQYAVVCSRPRPLSVIAPTLVPYSSSSIRSLTLPQN